MRILDRYLQKRGGRWHYVRRVPGRFEDLDARRLIRASLDTDHLEIARHRRDALVAADDEFWSSLLLIERTDAAGPDGRRLRETLQRRYRSASARAVARGFAYAPVETLAHEALLEDLVRRLAALPAKATEALTSHGKAEVEALLGGVEVPPTTISEAFETYCHEIALGDLLNKSPGQKRLWRKTKQRAVAYFIEVVGDKAIADITREDALKFYNWWVARLNPKHGADPLGANTANRDLGNLRKLYREYFRHLGDEDRANPFRNLSFKETMAEDVPPFENDWVRTRILVPGALAGLNGEAVLLAHALIETGCRPSEIANLTAEDIRLEAAVPFISIRPRRGREIKTASSIRDIPLVGVSLEALRRAPGGFPRYRDKNDLLSASLVKAFRNRALFPTEKHVIYSFRHSFEKRMLEAGIDYGLRCLLMGHATTRPDYGDGGAMAFRRDELLKIAHPFPADLFDDISLEAGRRRKR